MVPLRLFDPDRSPTNWTEIIHPGQYVAFAKIFETGAPCDEEGRPFAAPEAATCLLFDTLAEAERFCTQQVERRSDVRFDIFDSAGRTSPPLLVFVHPDKASRIEGNPRGMRLRAGVAALLIVLAVCSFWYDFTHGPSARYFPTLIGINFVVVAARLIQLNRSYVHAERVRQERLVNHRSS
jgi:hypothetical protein